MDELIFFIFLFSNSIIRDKKRRNPISDRGISPKVPWRICRDFCMSANDCRRICGGGGISPNVHWRICGGGKMSANVR